VVGGGLQIGSKHKGTNAFLQEWWEHPLNQLGTRTFEWCDEMIRSGEVFIAISTNAAGMSFCRAIPAIAIDQVITADNDLQQEIEYVEKDSYKLAGPSSEREKATYTGRHWPAYTAEDDQDPQGGFQTVMLHYAINRPAGAIRGESDLAPMLKWLTRYTSWLEDRVRLNRFRQAFLYIVKARFASETDRMARQAALNGNPPNPGAILVTDESEEWSILNPQLEAADANLDGLAIKKMIATGAGIPLHFMAEPEGTNKTTAESAGGPTFRHFEQRQEFFTWLVKDVARVVVKRRALVDGKVKAAAPIDVRGADLSSRDSIALAQASAEIITAFTGLYDKGLIDGSELVRLAYRFAGETVDIQALIERGAKDIENRPEVNSGESPVAGGQSKTANPAGQGSMTTGKEKGQSNG
jgi:hypothetical protein